MPPFENPEAPKIADAGNFSMQNFFDDISNKGIVSAVWEHPTEAGTTVVAGIAAAAAAGLAGRALAGAVERYAAAGVGDQLAGATGESVASGVREGATAGESILDGGLFSRGLSVERGVPDIAQGGSLKWLPTVPGSQSEVDLIDSPSWGLARSNWVSEGPPALRNWLERYSQPFPDLPTATVGDVGPYPAAKLSAQLGLGRPGFLDEIRSGRMSEFLGATHGGPSPIEALTPKSVSQTIGQFDFASALKRIQFWK